MLGTDLLAFLVSRVLIQDAEDSITRMLDDMKCWSAIVLDLSQRYRCLTAAIYVWLLAIGTPHPREVS